MNTDILEKIRREVQDLYDADLALTEMLPKEEEAKKQAEVENHIFRLGIYMDDVEDRGGKMTEMVLLAVKTITYLSLDLIRGNVELTRWYNAMMAQMKLLNSIYNTISQLNVLIGE